VNYTWEFLYNGSLKQLYGVSPTFEFWTEGVYDVTLTVRDEANQTSSAVVWITVEVEIPELPIVWMPVAGMLAVFLLTGISRRRGRPKRE
jgi:PKD repeat protein